jgi:hypothetical protein
MRIRLTLLAIAALAALAALAWIAIDHGLVAGARSAQPSQATVASAALPLQTDAEPSTAPTATSDHAAPSTMTAAAPTSADADRAAEQPSQASEPSGKSGSRLAALERRARAGDRKAARDWVDALIQCAAVSSNLQLGSTRTHLSHLDWNLYEPQHALRVELLGSLVDECRLLFPATDSQQAMLQLHNLIREAFGLWSASGDPFGQLARAQIDGAWPPPPDEWQRQQALAAAHLDAADPQTLIDLAEFYTDASRFSSQTAWRLAACDLGYDCSAGGALQRVLCLRELQCFQGSYEEELLQRLPPRQWQVAQAQRRALVEMLRRGETAAIFDVPPPGP